MLIFFVYYIISASFPSPEEIIASFPYLDLKKVSELDYNGYVQAQKELKENLAIVFIQQVTGKSGHTGNILLNSQYALIAMNTQYFIPPDPVLSPVVTIRSTLLQLVNLVRAHIQAL